MKSTSLAIAGLVLLQRVSFFCLAVPDDGISEEEKFFSDGGFKLFNILNKLHCLFVNCSGGFTESKNYGTF
jgi:hypothetical protein